ncbi:MAG: complex I subunit 5 family protein [Campylobacterales bacterium]
MIFAPILAVFCGLVFSVFVDIGFTYYVDWFMFGLSFRVDTISKVFLIFTSLVWFVGAIYSYISIDEHRGRYWFWFVLTFVGNYGLILSYDAIGFYMFFSMMSLASFGLIVHKLSLEAKNAAFVYIKYAVVGELMLFVATLIASRHYGGFSFELYTATMHPIALWLFIVGFGIKVGVLFLHFWLPLAHGNAPAAASAILSGVMLKAGVLGMMRFLPFGIEMNVLAGVTLVMLGVMGIYFGLYGLKEEKIKVVLAYSSISQMGYIVTLFGIGFLYPSWWDLLVVAIVFFSLHHAINKSALFILSGEILQNGLNVFYILLGAVFALSLVGVVFSSGEIAKEMIARATPQTIPFIGSMLSFGSVVTALLMIKAYFLSRKISKNKSFDKRSIYLLLPLGASSLLLYFIGAGFV